MEIDDRCPMDIVACMAGIADQCGKKHYFNALIRMAEMQVLLTLHLRAAINQEPEPDTTERWHYGPVRPRD